MSIYLVTGGAGFIGSHITTGLVQRGDRVRILDDLSTGVHENLAHLDVGAPGSGAQLELVVGDISDAAASKSNSSSFSLSSSVSALRRWFASTRV